MTAAAASVIIVSRGRPTALTRCLTGVSQLFHSRFEVIVVSDAEGLAAVDRAGWTGRIKTVLFNEPNISAARNLGLAQAAGEIVAFIDDDAVPEPTWLSALTAPFADPAISAAGGFVRGRNGISFQWKARDVRSDGTSGPLQVGESTVTILHGRPGLGTKTEGTNMTFRRDVIAALGGFDPAFRFYLDETDLNLRLAATEAMTAVVPLAQVHHGFAESDRRRADRVPRTLFEEGASRAVLLRKHAPDRLEEQRALATKEQRVRLLQHMIAGRIEPGDVSRILDSFHAGWAEGMRREITPLERIGPSETPFHHFETQAREHVVLAARSIRKKCTLDKAKALVIHGKVVTVLLLSPSARYHRAGFDSRGFWLQTGGLFGKSDRSEPIFRFWRFMDRVNRETDRVKWFRSAA